MRKGARRGQAGREKHPPEKNHQNENTGTGQEISREIFRP
jgi:hypothetical protein